MTTGNDEDDNDGSFSLFFSNNNADLVQSSKDHVRFLREMHRLGVTIRSPSLQSFHRYVDCWLPLVHSVSASAASATPTASATTSTGGSSTETTISSSNNNNNNSNTSSPSSLIPPPDIAWLWHCHRLAPLEYEQYCLKLRYNNNNNNNNDGIILEASPPFSFQTESEQQGSYYGRRDELITKMLWKQRYPNEPFFLQQQDDDESDNNKQQQKQDLDEAGIIIQQKCKERLGGYDVFDSAKAQTTFLWQISSTRYYDDDEFLKDGVNRYYKFLQLARVMDRSIPIVPTFQIDLMWHTHILMSVSQYNKECMEICGRKFRHDDSFNDRSSGGSLENAFHKTCELWSNQYNGSNYVVKGAMYRGEPPKEYYDNYDTWYDDYSSSSQKRNWNLLASYLTKANITRRRLVSSSSSSGALFARRLRLSSLFIGRNNNDASSTKNSVVVVTWRDLLYSRGTDLWTLRKQALITTTTKSDEDDDDEVMDVLIPMNHNRNCPTVHIIGSGRIFQSMESHQGMDKVEMSSSGGGGRGKSLTQEVGEEWERQRELVAKKALCEVKELSLKAVDTVLWKELLSSMDDYKAQTQSTIIVVDLKKLVIDACLAWVTRLFQGHICNHTSEDASDLRESFSTFWQEIRALHKNNDSLKTAQAALIQSIQRNTTSGLFRHMFNQQEQGAMTTEQTSMNCVNAMVAAFDTTVVIVFWTLWNLARTDGAWLTCRTDMSTKNDDLEKLAKLKKAATEGEPVCVSSLSYLGRAMVESIRVYPPVWTLPRIRGDKKKFVKLDVPWMNRALDRDWNLNRSDAMVQIASFGIGKRHCPAGTAALFAAHRLLDRFVQEFEAPKECDPDRALRSLYLGPTLCMEGPQYFELRSATEQSTG